MSISNAPPRLSFYFISFFLLFGNEAKIFFYRAVRPWFKNNWIFSLTEKGKEQTEALDTLHTFTTKVRAHKITAL